MRWTHFKCCVVILTKMTVKSFMPIRDEIQVSTSSVRWLGRSPDLQKHASMSFPAPQQWLFSVKTFAAAVLALLISLWIALPNPYWALATVYIASNPLSGATRSKAIFRVLGTLIGATAAVVMMPNLAGAPVLLVLALATWSAICLYISLLDRTPRSYVFMLAGYTAALIGFPTVDVPGTVFDVALARTEEIIIGILCAAVISSVVFPRAVAPVVIQRLRAWLRDADSSARDALETKTGPEADAHRLRLAADTGEIENSREPPRL